MTSSMSQMMISYLPDQDMFVHSSYSTFIKASLFLKKEYGKMVFRRMISKENTLKLNRNFISDSYGA